jgi:hypothetical protein
MTEQTPETVVDPTSTVIVIEEKATFRSHFTMKRIAIIAAATAAAVTVLYLALKDNESKPLFEDSDADNDADTLA